MKSLKNEKSIKQISSEHLLGITLQPEITCPIVDSLLLGQRGSLRAFDNEPEFDPCNLYISEDELNKLLEATSDLIIWADDLIAIYENNKEDIMANLGNDSCESIQKIIDEVIILRDSFNERRILQLLDSIDSTLDDWTKYHERYLEALRTKETLEDFLPPLESKLDKYDPNVRKDCIKEFARYLKMNDIIDQDQLKVVYMFKTKDDVIDLLKNLGYKKIYYYENPSDFLNNPHNYKLDCENTQKKIKIKI